MLLEDNFFLKNPTKKVSICTDCIWKKIYASWNFAENKEMNLYQSVVETYF